MNKQEFEKKIGGWISVEQYWDIEFVYTWHPSVPEFNGKEVIAQLYKIGGMRLIRDMMPTANAWRKLSIQRDELKAQIAVCEDAMNALAKGEAWNVEP